MRKVHLVGSSPFRDAAEAFEQFGRHLSDVCGRYPDGETGERTNWITWQDHVLRNHPQFKLIDTILDPRDKSRPFTKYRLADGVRAEDVHFGPLGYAREAESSFAVFQAKQRERVLPHGARFQVSLPTPLCFIEVFFSDPILRAALEGAYRDAMIEEVKQITKAIPSQSLAIQWDVAVELHRLEARSLAARTATERKTVESGIGVLAAKTADLCNSVPAEVNLLLHLCYGDFGHKHAVEPPSLSLCARVTLSLMDHLRRPLDLVHVPVPRDRHDPSYFEPVSLIADKNIPLCLGLIHLTDGMEGTTRRINTAASFVREFAIATECGLGRRPRESMQRLLELHRQVASL